MRIVFSVGGSVLAPDELDDVFLEDATGFFRDLSRKHRIWVVVGGGRIARKYIKAAKNLGADDDLCDWLGIYATRLNALLLSSAIGKKANRRIPLSTEEALELSRGNGIVCMGGTTPKHSTDAVAAELAEAVSADLFINASNVDGVFDKDPKKFSGAKLVPRMNARELQTLVKEIPQSPGNYALIDKMAVKSIIRSKIKTIILNGRNLENMRNAISGGEFVGTEITCYP